MNLLRKALLPLGGVVAIVLVVSLAAPPAVHAVAAALVQVANTPTTAVPTVAAPAESQLFSAVCGYNLPNGPSNNVSCSFPAVPAGQTLFIETVSIVSASSPGADPYLALIYNGSVSISMPMVQQANGPGGTDQFVGTLAGRVAVKQGAVPLCVLGLNKVSNSGSMSCTITGYLAPAE